MARSTKDTIAISETLADRGADLVSLSERIDTTTAAGKMVFRMLAVLSEFDGVPLQDVIQELVRAYLDGKVKLPASTGKPKLG